MKKIFHLILFSVLIFANNNINAQIVSVPYETGFEGYDFGDEWSIEVLSGDPSNGHIWTLWNDVYAGNKSVEFVYDIPVGIGGSYEEENLLAFDLSIDLTGNNGKEIVMDYASKVCDGYYGNLTNFTNCGIYFSDNNGLNYVKVLNINQYHDWQLNSISISQLATQYGLALTDDFKIRFQFFVGIDYNQSLRLDAISVYSQCFNSYTFENTSILHYSPNTNGIYNAVDNIHANNNVNIISGTTVKFAAGNSIKLNPGFHSLAGSHLQAYIQECVSKELLFNNTIVNNETQKDLSKMLDIYPNPTNGIVNINTNDEFQRIEIKDIFGKTIIQTNTVNISNQFDLSNYSKGMYFVLLYKMNDEILVEKIVLN